MSGDKEIRPQTDAERLDNYRRAEALQIAIECHMQKVVGIGECSKILRLTDRLHRQFQALSDAPADGAQ